jgi:hypothetical protein
VTATVARHFRWLALVVVVALLATTFLKGTSPGGPGAWEEYRASRDSDRES